MKKKRDGEDGSREGYLRKEWRQDGKRDL